MSASNDYQLIAEAREWESVAENLDHQNAILLTVLDVLYQHHHIELTSIVKLLENSTDVIHDLCVNCANKHQAITTSRLNEGVSHG